MKNLALVMATLFVAGCASPRVTPIGNDVFIISSSSAFNGTSKKTEIIEEANKFAASRGKVAVAVSLKESHPAVGLGGQFEYQFKLVDAGGVSGEADEQKELQRLEKLHNEGLITDDEFAILKSRLSEKR